MPRILLVDCPPALFDALSANPDNDVVRVRRPVRGEEPSVRLPDPRKFGLVIDNGCNIETDGVGVDPAASVAHPLFLAGLSEAQGLLLAIGSCRQSDEESWHRTLNGKDIARGSRQRSSTLAP
jgi:hypothetical protein